MRSYYGLKQEILEIEGVLKEGDRLIESYAVYIALPVSAMNREVNSYKDNVYHAACNLHFYRRGNRFFVTAINRASGESIPVPESLVDMVFEDQGLDFKICRRIEHLDHWILTDDNSYQFFGHWKIIGYKPGEKRVVEKRVDPHANPFLDLALDLAFKGVGAAVRGIYRLARAGIRKL